jgi:predicted nuclease with RNAse H fold
MTTVLAAGIDLSGPSSPRKTCVVVLRCRKSTAEFVQSLPAAGDPEIYALIEDLSRQAPLVAGLDAPLSCQPGGGLRSRDRSLRERIVARGMRHGSVMPPTFNRMAYLTLRGLAVARLLSTLNEARVQTIEVHPGATFCLRGAPLASVLAFKKKKLPEHREVLLEWLSTQGIKSLPCSEQSSHFVAAAGAALAAWAWSRKQSVWLAVPEPPFHPYPFAC